MNPNAGFRLFAIPCEGRSVRTGVWDGRRDYSVTPPPELAAIMEGPKCCIVQVGRPTNGSEGRSSLDLTRVLAKDHDSIIHWSRDTQTFDSIVEELSKSTGGKEIEL